jgi:hypothetical protein
MICNIWERIPADEFRLHLRPLHVWVWSMFGALRAVWGLIDFNNCWIFVALISCALISCEDYLGGTFFAGWSQGNYEIISVQILYVRYFSAESLKNWPRNSIAWNICLCNESSEPNVRTALTGWPRPLERFLLTAGEHSSRDPGHLFYPTHHFEDIEVPFKSLKFHFRHHKSSFSYCFLPEGVTRVTTTHCLSRPCRAECIEIDPKLDFCNFNPITNMAHAWGGGGGASRYIPRVMMTQPHS